MSRSVSSAASLVAHPPAHAHGHNHAASIVSASSVSYGGHISSSSRFKRLEKIGQGSFGDVFKATDMETNETVAVKVINLEEAEDEIDDIRGEITMLSECQSAYVTRYITSYTSGPELCIVMEYLGGGSVHDLLTVGPLDEQYVAVVTRELLKACDYMHSSGKIHRDIKAANVLLSCSGDVKLSDFGVTASVTNAMQKRNTFVGTPFWMAPEVIKQSEYNEKCDIWSIGITVIEMFLGVPPLHDVHPMKALFLIPKSDAPSLESNKDASKALKEFVALCCQKDYSKRPSVKTLLTSKFIRGAKKNAILQDLLAERAAARGNLNKSMSATTKKSTSAAGVTSANSNNSGVSTQSKMKGIGTALSKDGVIHEKGDGDANDGGDDDDSLDDVDSSEDWSFTVREPSARAIAAAAAAAAVVKLPSPKAMAAAAAKATAASSAAAASSPFKMVDVSAASRLKASERAPPSNHTPSIAAVAAPRFMLQPHNTPHPPPIPALPPPRHSTVLPPSSSSSAAASASSSSVSSPIPTPRDNSSHPAVPAAVAAMMNSADSHRFSLTNTIRGARAHVDDDVSSGSGTDTNEDEDDDDSEVMGTVRQANPNRADHPPPHPNLHSAFNPPIQRMSTTGAGSPPPLPPPFPLSSSARSSPVVPNRSIIGKDGTTQSVAQALAKATASAVASASARSLSPTVPTYVNQQSKLTLQTASSTRSPSPNIDIIVTSTVTSPSVPSSQSYSNTIAASSSSNLDVPPFSSSLAASMIAFAHDPAHIRHSSLTMLLARLRTDLEAVESLGPGMGGLLLAQLGQSTNGGVCVCTTPVAAGRSNATSPTPNKSASHMPSARGIVISTSNHSPSKVLSPSAPSSPPIVPPLPLPSQSALLSSSSSTSLLIGSPLLALQSHAHPPTGDRRTRPPPPPPMPSTLHFNPSSAYSPLSSPSGVVSHSTVLPPLVSPSGSHTSSAGTNDGNPHPPRPMGFATMKNVWQGRDQEDAHAATANDNNNHKRGPPPVPTPPTKI